MSARSSASAPTQPIDITHASAPARGSRESAVRHDRHGSRAPGRGLRTPAVLGAFAALLLAGCGAGDIDTEGKQGGDGDDLGGLRNEDGADGSSADGSGGDGSSGDGTSSDGETGDGTDGSVDPSNDPHQRCVDRINELRASVGLDPLQRWTEQEACSDQQSQTDLESAGAHGSFGQCGEGGQNTCPGWGSVDDVIGGCLMAMWNEGPAPSEPCDGACFQAHGHYINMTNPGYTRVACGFYTAPDGTTWSNQNYQ